MKKFTLLFSFTLSMILLTRISSAQTTILSTDFETGQPAGWTITTDATDGGWNFGTNTQLQSANFPITAHTKMACSNDDGCNCDKSADYFITPSMDWSTYTNIFMTFDSYFFNLTYNGAQESATIEVSTDGGTTWELVKTLSPGGWVTDNVNFTAYAGESNVMVAFHYNDGGDWLYGWALDNVSIYEPIAGTDVSVSTFSVGKLDPTPLFVGFPTYLTGLSLSPKASLVNMGTAVITALDISWTDGANTYTQSLTGLSIDPLTSYDFTPSDSYTTLAGSHSISFSVTNVNNGATELSTGNNSLSYNVNGVTADPNHNYLAEEATGTWCGWCPRGTVFMDYMREQYPDQFVGIAVHNGDPMVVTDYDDGIGGFPGFPGYPSVVTNRNTIIDPSELEFDFINQVTSAPAVHVSIQATLDPNSNKLQVVATGDFQQNLTGDYRFNVVVVEDSVHGTSSGYKQTNYYADNAAGLMAGWESMAASVPATQMYYEQVGRALLGGYDGTVNSLPSSINSGDVLSYTYTYTVPSTINVNHMWVAAMVLENNTGEVLNTNKSGWVFGSVGISNVPNNASVFMYPNPAKDVAYLDIRLAHANDVHIQVTNAIGQVVSTFNYASLSNDQILPLNISNLSGGIYSVEVKVGEQTITRKLVIAN